MQGGVGVSKQLEVMNAGEVDGAAMNAKADKGVFVNGNTLAVTPWKDLRGDVRIYRAWQSMHGLMNSQFLPLDVVGMEVGEAYNELFRIAIEDERFTDFPWVMTLESDNLVPPDARIRLMRAITRCPDCDLRIGELEFRCANGHRGYDAVGGIYFTKDEAWPTPMAFGDPASKVLEFRPRDVRDAMKEGRVIEVNGVAMGCTIFKKASVAAMKAPWFVTDEFATQDLSFCRRAKEEMGARFAVDCGVKVGHIDFRTGVIH